jgi:hypothetical protein
MGFDSPDWPFMGCFFDWYLWDLRCASDADLLWTIAASIAGTVVFGVLVMSLCVSPRHATSSAPIKAD